MVQVSDRVGTAQKGSIKAVSGSGMASMSEASMLFQPRIEEPSKPRPSSKISSVSSRIGQAKCCQVPKVSTNLISIILAAVFLANSITLLGVLIYGLLRLVWLGLSFPDRPRHVAAIGPDFKLFESLLFASECSFGVIALFAMLGEVQAGGFHFRRN